MIFTPELFHFMILASAGAWFFIALTEMLGILATPYLEKVNIGKVLMALASLVLAQVLIISALEELPYVKWQMTLIVFGSMSIFIAISLTRTQISINKLKKLIKEAIDEEKKKK